MTYQMVTIHTKKKGLTRIPSTMVLKNIFVMEPDKINRFIEAIKGNALVVDIQISDTFKITENEDLAIAAIGAGPDYEDLEDFGPDDREQAKTDLLEPRQ